ncbi:hypothetical protein GCM10010404_32550 [Nonomuraea africana]
MKRQWYTCSTVLIVVAVTGRGCGRPVGSAQAGAVPAGAVLAGAVLAGAVLAGAVLAGTACAGAQAPSATTVPRHTGTAASHPLVFEGRVMSSVTGTGSTGTAVSRVFPLPVDLLLREVLRLVLRAGRLRLLEPRGPGIDALREDQAAPSSRTVTVAEPPSRSAGRSKARVSRGPVVVAAREG